MNPSKQNELQLAFKLSMPIFYAYFPLGIVFGILLAHSNFAWYWAPLMSIMTYAGAVQFVALSMMQEHANIYSIILATVFIAFRNSFYGLNFLTRFNSNWLMKGFLIFTLVDANYAILVSNPPQKNHNDIKFCFWLALFIALYWMIGTFVGALCAHWIPPLPQLSFILTSFFMILVINFYVSKRKWHTLVMPIICVIAAYLIAPKNYLLISIVFSIISILTIQHIEKKTNEQ